MELTFSSQNGVVCATVWKQGRSGEDKKTLSILLMLAWCWGQETSSWTSGSSSECSYLASWQVVYWAKPEGIEHPCVISSSWSPSPRYRLAPGEHHLRYIPLRGFSRIPLHSQTRGNLKALEMCGHFLLTGMFSVQVPDWCLNKRSVVLFLEAQFFCLNNKTLHPFYKGLLSQRAGRIYRSPLINSHMAYCLICLRCRAKWFQHPVWKGESRAP